MVGHHVVFKTNMLWKCLVILAALIWFLSWMWFEMHFKFIIPWKRLSTLAALAWFLSSVCCHVAFYIALCNEVLVTLTTLIGFLGLCFEMCKLTILWTNTLSHWLHWSYSFSQRLFIHWYFSRLNFRHYSNSHITCLLFLNWEYLWRTVSNYLI